MQQEEIMDIDLGVGLTIAIEGKLIDGSEIEDRSTTHSTVMEVIPLLYPYQLILINTII